MHTVRLNTFETNSSSCHVLTIMTEDEVNALKNHDAFIYVPKYNSDSDEVYDSEVLDKAKLLELCKKKGIDISIDGVEQFFDDMISAFKSNSYFDIDEYTDEHNIDDNSPMRNVLDIVEDNIFYNILHNESINDILCYAKTKEVNGSKIYVAAWEKYC